MEATRLFDILDRYKEINPNQKVALSCKREGQWINYSLDDYITKTNYISAGLLSIGVKKGDRIAIISSSRPEYNMIDMGIMQIGAITVPIYPTISEADYNHILNHAEISYVFSEGEELLRKIESILPTVPSIKGIYTFKDRGRHKYLAELLELGEAQYESKKAEIEKIKASIGEDDTACIIYTSGTTGLPKGVMISHKNIMMQVKETSKIPADWSDTAFSFLPLCHAYEKLMVYMYQYRGMSIYYAESLGTIIENIKEVNPTIMTCVPRVLEKIYDKIFAAGKKLPYAKRQIYFWAIKLALNYRKDLNPASARLYKIADKFVYSKWREAIGGHFDTIVSGGAALQPRLAAFFTAIGMPIFEGYGLTETSPVIAVSTKEPDGLAFGTVGKPLRGVEVKIDSETSEIICRGDNVMKGYYKAPDLTAQVIDKDGWFHTGDTGRFTEAGQLVVTGRLKGIFKTSMGKYINPFVIEEKFSQSPFIDNIMVVGENQKFAAAIISPSFHFLKSWCKSHKVPYTSDSAIIEDERVKARINEEVKKYNQTLGETEKIKRITLVPEEWTVKNKLLTPTLKVKRPKIMEKYNEEIEKMFQ
ncbi:MAG: long-chain fatty acid--CoA ligase [Paludibacteraceae bacterium]|nr:long-chain fatty acid--CoA ligase [Paludibacteraceae bacterium]